MEIKMKGLKIMIGICMLILIVGCSPSLEDYKCNVGEREGNNCYTEIQTTSWKGCGKILDWQILTVDEFIYSRGEYTHMTQSNCVYEELEIINVTDFKINDSSIESYWDDFRGRYFVLENNGDTKEVCINATYTYRWRRFIWEEDKTSFPTCISELKSVNAELIEHPSFLLDFTW